MSRLPKSVIKHVPVEDFAVYEPAGFVLRWYAFTLDLTFAGPLDVLAKLPFGRFLERAHAFGHDAQFYLLSVLLSALPVLVYFVLPTRAFGQTLGKRIVGLRVVDFATRGTRLGITQAVVRETFGKLLSVLLFGLGILMVVVRVDRRALHDRLSGTTVVSRRVRTVPSTGRSGR